MDLVLPLSVPLILARGGHDKKIIMVTLIHKLVLTYEGRRKTYGNFCAW